MTDWGNLRIFVLVEGEQSFLQVIMENSTAVLISGGVDSSVVVHLLMEEGIRPDLYYIRIGANDVDYMDCTAEEDMEICTAVAHHYGLKLRMVDLHREYWDQVAVYAIDKIRRGLTPNPDVMCNRLIKFGCFEQQVGKDYQVTATGHYAKTYQEDGLVWLGTAVDPVKDQTDFLAQITYDQLKKLRFPLGNLMKTQVREIARKALLPSAQRRDSQGICFLNNINYNDFVRRFLGEKPGKIVELETGKVLGQHKGFWFHTIGQRKGLGLSGGPWFVIAKDIEENTVFVSNGYDCEAQFGRALEISGMNFLTRDPWTELPQKGVDVAFKIRHTPEFTRGILKPSDKGYLLESSEKLQGIAPGQYAVIYDAAHRLVYGSGEITVRHQNL